jgi:hypothetical protein
MEADDRILTQLLMDFSLFEDAREKALPIIPSDLAIRATHKQKEVALQVADLLTQGRSKLLKMARLAFGWSSVTRFCSTSMISWVQRFLKAGVNFKTKSLSTALS